MSWWLSTLLLLSANPGSAARTSPGSSPAPTTDQDPVNDSVTKTPAPQADQNQPTQIPQVNLTADGLDELLAPIALYPDPVLAIMLQASADPQEVMDGGNWLLLDQNKDLQAAALDEASKQAGFTPVMQALLHYPTVVDLMCTQFDWTKQLGAAYQANPRAVLDSVQRLRAQAVDTGALKSSPQMTVDYSQKNGEQVVELKPTNPQVIYIPQYNPEQVFQTTTTTTTRPDGTTVTTSTTTGPTPTTSSNSTTVVQQSSGVSRETAATIGLLSFGAGIALGTAISSHNYYYPAWWYGGIWYGPRPYYPPPYHPIYYPGWGPGYWYRRPVHYGTTNIYINNNYYYRFQNNNNLSPDYKPRPVPYSTKPNSTYSKNMGSQPGAKQGVNYRSSNSIASTRPATGNGNWKGQTTYQGNKGAGHGATPESMPTRNPSGDRGFPQNGGARPSTGRVQPNRPTAGSAPSMQPSAGYSSDTRPSAGSGNLRPSSGEANTRSEAGNAPAAKPAYGNRPPARPASQPQQLPQPPNGEAFSGASSPNSDRAASNRGHQSMGASASQKGQPPASGGKRRN
jgi:hypothetical protein